jgi:hypothetical protein
VSGDRDERGATAEVAPPIVDWAVIGRRLRWTAAGLFALALLAWAVAGAAGDGLRLADLWGYLGLALAGLFVAEVVVVGGSAVRGLLRAGERGERLAGDDVGILPPQLARRRSGRGGSRP